MMKKRLLSMILVLCMLCALLPIGLPAAQAYSSTDIAYPVESGNLYFDKETGTVTDCDVSVTKADIPAEIDGVAVTSIGEEAFSSCIEMTGVTIPDGILNIDREAFSDCVSLTGITLPDSVTTIGNQSFYGCSSLTSVDLGEGVTTIGAMAFWNCFGLTSVMIPKSVTTIGSSAFLGCNSLTAIHVAEDNAVYASDDGVLFNKDKTNLIRYPGGKEDARYVIPDSVTTIDSEAFDNCDSLTSVTIPESVTSIGYEAFFLCSSLTNVAIPASVTSIGYGAFLYCGSLTAISVAEENLTYSSVDGVLFNTEKTTLIFYPAGKTDIDYTIPNTVTSIDSHAFSGCCNLTSVTIPDSVTSIGDAFNGCSSLKSVTILEGVTSIGNYAFYACSSLTSVTIPDSVTSIGNYAFYACSSLTSVTIPESVTSIGESAFYDCSSLASVCFLGDAPELGYNVFQEWSDVAWGPINIPSMTLYYIEGKAGWTTPTWNGYPTATWIPHEHSYVDTVTAPTCTEQGYTTHTCTVCGDSYTDTYVAALGHSFVNGVCERCGEEDPNYKPADAFTDVSKTQWYYSAVNFAVENSLFLGTSDTTFSPNEAMTRAMLVTVLWRLEGKPEAGTQTGFKDVPAGEYYAQPVAWAAANGIVMGTSDATFSPNGKITREQMAAILYRYAQKKGYDTTKSADLSKFPDNGKVSSYARQSLAWANAEGLINGDEQANGTVLLDPAGNAIRAQVAAILMRYVQNIVE